MLPTSAGASPTAKPSRARRLVALGDRRSGLSLPLTLALLATAALAGGLIGRRTAGTPAAALVPHGGAAGRATTSGGFVAPGSAALAVPGAGGRKLPKLFLFIGILSGRGYRHRRLAVREAWAGPAQLAPVSLCRFVLSEDEATAQVRVMVVCVWIVCGVLAVRWGRARRWRVAAGRGGTKRSAR